MSDTGLLAIPEWTEIGQDTGLDPLAMVRPTEALYQSLVPGISTITQRLRYYAFFPWLLEQYAKRVGDRSIDTFRHFQRRAEALYALIGVNNGYETGITGANWASEASKVKADRIRFDQAADPQSATRYLKNKAGAYGAIYASQMREMGLVDSAEAHDIDIVTDRGRLIAEAFGESIAEASTLFLEVVERGDVTRGELSALTVFKLGNIPPASSEQVFLQRLLVGGLQGEMPADVSRRLTMHQLLRLSALLGKVPTPIEAKWAWYQDGAADDRAENTDAALSLRLWRLYHTNDLLRLAYEGILKHSLDLLAAATGRTLTLTELVEQIASGLGDNNPSWTDFCEDAATAGDILPERVACDEISAKGAPGATTDSSTLAASVTLLAIVSGSAAEQSKLIREALRADGHFHSLHSELAFLETVREGTVADVLRAITRDRVIKRHLWVAARKLRTQRAYTYLAEVEEGRLKHRSGFTATLSSPRLDQSLTFLIDAGLLREDGLTEAGRDALELR